MNTVDQDWIENIRTYSRQMVRELGMLEESYSHSQATHPQCHALLTLESHGAISVTELADQLRVDKSTASRLVDQMIAKKWVDKIVHPADRRAKLLELTTAGSEQVRLIHHLAQSRIAEALPLLKPEEMRLIEDGLKVYARALARARRREEHQIRPIERSDNSGVRDLIRTVMPEFGAQGAGFAINDPEVTRMYQHFQSPGRRFFVVDHQKRVVGGAGIAELSGGDENICELQKMYFLPQTRGLGLGKDLLSRCLIAAKQLGYQFCYLETLEHMTGARKLYESFGFERLPSPIGQTGHHACDVWYGLKL